MLEKIKSPDNIKNFTSEQIKVLTNELRQEILESCAKNGGHLASNLGMVEATVALHRVFDCPRDSIVFDVGHQCYAHKLLTGRYDSFSSLRQYGGISGFTNRDESEYDVLTAGHSGSALSTALGIARAKAYDPNGGWTVAVIGDGSFTNGMVFEALNCCSDEGLQLIILLNDNEMSISKNVGAMSGYFSSLRNSRRYFAFKKRLQKFLHKLPCGNALIMTAFHIKEFFKRLLFHTNLFENLGLYYLGPVNGNDEEKLESLLREAKTKDKCTIIHMLTLKGKGYSPAERNPEIYHFAGGFDPAVGAKEIKENSFSSVTGEYLCRKKALIPSLCAVTAAMEKGTGLRYFRDRYPEAFYDVGIAEECAVTFTGGLAIGGATPVCALYSTFLQRAYDQILEDIAIQKTHVVLAIDRAGLVAGDGITHQGIFDVSLLSSIPDITIYSPESYDELCLSFDRALEGSGLWAVRYPKGSEKDYDRSVFSPVDNDCTVFETDVNDPDITIITYGRITHAALKAAEMLSPLKIRIIRLLKLAPLDSAMILDRCRDSRFVYFLEEGIKRGGAGENLASFASKAGSFPPVYIRAVDAQFVPHGDLDSIMQHCGFKPEQIADEINTFIKHIN